MRVKSMAQSLALTDEQKEKVKPIIEEEIKKMEELSQDRTGAPEERMKKFRDLREATNAKIKPLLSAEQQEKLANLTQRSQRRIEPTNGKTNAAPAAPGSPTAPAKPAPPAK
jgi:Spy/CpxP family protein refolding chaperone